MSPNTQLNIFADRDKFFFSRISKKPVCFSGKHKVANLNPYSKGWTTETGVVVLALINVPCKSSLSSDVNIYGRDVREPKRLLESIRTPWPTFRGWVGGEKN